MRAAAIHPSVRAVRERGHAFGLGRERIATKIHDLENVGDADFWFATVEFLDSANAPLDLGL